MQPVAVAGWFGTMVMSMMALVLIITYFVTSSDSGTLVVTTLISMGKGLLITYRVFRASARCGRHPALRGRAAGAADGDAGDRRAVLDHHDVHADPLVP
ncbi:MAG: BCCT family transporter [Halofilum sp. (in: g-proteobacteria)]|nr:BCCT family transporter [Halofilum sp. (in: g-proteobacteria)]